MHSYEESLILSQKIAREAEKLGGKAYYVGGMVRDEILGIKTKDIDMEIHRISPTELYNMLVRFGEVITIGESFGIYNLKGYSIDIALPRTENATGKGHRDFDVKAEPFIGEYKAASRRDFTMNALMKNVLTGEITDNFGGIDDIKNNEIRHVNDISFTEDPLRVLRAAQFAARFNFSLDKKTVSLCKAIDIKSLSPERVEGELRKALLKSDKPSIFFEVLRETEQFSYWFKEIKSLIGVPQNPKFHMEGDVWNHTKLVLDEAAKLRHKVKNPFGFMLAALTHDVGKAVCTEFVKGAIHAYQHESKGKPLAKAFMTRITKNTNLIKYVLNMTKLHMKPNTMASCGSAVKATNKMFDEAVEPTDLIYLAVADGNGTINANKNVSYEEFLFERLDIYRKTMAKPYVTGDDLIRAGLIPGVNFKEILNYAHKLRLAGVNKYSALKQTLAYARKFK